MWDSVITQKGCPLEGIYYKEGFMIEVEITTLDIERETGIKHHKVIRDVKDKWLAKFPLNDEGFSLSRMGQSDFLVESTTYTNVRGKEYPAFKFNRNAANAFMANYKLEHAMKMVDYIVSLEAENIRLEEENRIMKDIVWEVINGQAYIGQEQALKMAGIRHPRLFMKYLKSNEKFYDSVVFERGLIKDHQCNKHGDRWWKFTKDGFQWLLQGKDTLNNWVDKQKLIEKQSKNVPC